MEIIFGKYKLLFVSIFYWVGLFFLVGIEDVIKGIGWYIAAWIFILMVWSIDGPFGSDDISD